jgi:type VI secretion system protein ImpF
MADKTIAERLQPSLLDRLTDNNPELSVEKRENRVLNLSDLRQIVKRDLSWLLNTTNQGAVIDDEIYPHVARSVLNYGVGESSGSFSTSERAKEIRKTVKEAIENFEPRIMEGTLNVELNTKDSENGSVVTFDIVADMWAQPLPIELYLRSQVNLISGELTLERQN